MPSGVVTIDYSIGFTKQEIEQILAVHKLELQKTLVAWTDSGSSITKRRIDEIHAVIGACQAALKKLDPQTYGTTHRVAQSDCSDYLPK